MRKKTLVLGKGYYLLIAAVLIAIAIWLFQISETKRSDQLIEQRYGEEADKIGQIARQMIEAKKKATTALALTLAQNNALGDLIGNPQKAKEYFDAYVRKMREKTPYKNVWIELVDRRGRTVYQSWRDAVSGEALLLPDENGTDTVETLFVNRSDLLIAASVPIESTGRPAGRLRVFTHFNSIARALERQDIQTLVIVTPDIAARITHRFTAHTVGDYYIALRDPSMEILRSISETEIGTYCKHSGMYVRDGDLLVSERLQGAQGGQMGCILLFKPLGAIDMDDISLFKWQNIFLFSLLGVAVFIVLTMIVFAVLRQQRKYYKDILDTSSNILVVTDGEGIIDVNRTFFKYFDTFEGLEDFKKKHHCICHFFANEKGFLRPEMEGKNWVEYLLEYPDRRHLAKINFGGETHVFSVMASALPLTNPQRSSVIFTEITREWLNERELERISLTDPLTGVYNRRYFDRQFSDELSRSRRYGSALSLIMFDIDYFKKINDRLGHEAGDKVLKQMSVYVQDAMREQDRLCRVGGEEFVIISPNADLDAAMHFAERIRLGVEKMFTDQGTVVTISLGVYECRSDEDGKACYAAADRALYTAKREGRNCVRSG